MSNIHARNSDDTTSHRAVPDNLNVQTAIMLEAYTKASLGGLTAREAQHISGISWRRSSDLLNRRLIRNTDETRVCQFTGQGKPGRVRVVTAS